jgi:hypothetical protein
MGGSKYVEVKKKRGETERERKRGFKGNFPIKFYIDPFSVCTADTSSQKTWLHLAEPTKSI